MQTLKHIDIGHLAQFREIILAGLKHETYDHKPPNLLDWARKTYAPYFDELYQIEAQPEIFSHAFEYMHLIALTQIEPYEDEDPANPEPERYHLADCEPDLVYFSIPFKDQYTKGIDPLEPGSMELLFTLVMLIMMSDCTDCCNAIDTLNVSKAGIFASGYIGQTYHS